MTNHSVIKRAVVKAGGLAPLARAIGVKYQAIQRWKKIPAGRVLAIEHVTGIPREQLRPDLYGTYQPKIK